MDFTIQKLLIKERRVTCYGCDFNFLIVVTLERTVLVDELHKPIVPN
jgi:hypothetical protein